MNSIIRRRIPSLSKLNRVSSCCCFSQKVWTSNPTDVINRPLGEGKAGYEPTRVIDMMKSAAENFGDQPAIHQSSMKLSWKEYIGKCDSFAKSLIALGVVRHKIINIIGFNHAAWMIANNGSMLAGAIAAGVYTTSSAEACMYIAQDSEVELLVVEDNMQLRKYVGGFTDKETGEQKNINNLPHLKAVAMYRDTCFDDDLVQQIPSSVRLLSFDELLELGQDVPDSAVTAAQDGIEPGHCSTLIYTSGTTGSPKGVMISHDNITWSSRVLREQNLGFATCKERVISYLPLSHVSAQLLDIHIPMAIEPDVLKGSLLPMLLNVKPTIFFGVPRVWEKIEEKMKDVGRNNTGIKKAIGDWAKSVGTQHSRSRQHGSTTSSPWSYPIAKRIAFDKVKQQLGLDETKAFYTGAAPISTDTLDYFASLDIPLYEAYGMSENSGVHSCGGNGLWSVGTIGKTLPGITTKIDPATGQVLCKGRNVFMGYMNMPDQTAGTFNDEGYLLTGDSAIQSNDEFITITGRLKELIITKGGENVAPLLIEKEMMTQMPVLSNCLVIGDQRKYLTMVNVVVETNEPTDDLAPLSLHIGKTIGSSATTVTQASTDEKWITYINNGLNAANEHAVSNAQKVQKWRLLPVDLSEKAGDLTSTLKIKRSVVNKKYDYLANEMYDE